MAEVFAISVQRDDDRSVRIRSHGGGPDIPIQRIVPHPNTARLTPGQSAIGHTDYRRDGTGEFGFRPYSEVYRQGQKTSHAREYEQTTGRSLGTGRNKVVSGHAYDGRGLLFNSSTHNTGRASHTNPDYYDRDGSREAGPTERNLHRDAMEAWMRDGQPIPGWEYNVKTGRAEGPNAYRGGNSAFDLDGMAKGLSDYRGGNSASDVNGRAKGPNAYRGGNSTPDVNGRAKGPNAYRGGNSASDVNGRGKGPNAYRGGNSASDLDESAKGPNAYRDPPHYSDYDSDSNSDSIPNLGIDPNLLPLQGFYPDPGFDSDSDPEPIFVPGSVLGTDSDGLIIPSNDPDVPAMFVEF